MPVPARAMPHAVRLKLGDDASEGLLDMFAAAENQSEARMTQAICTLRVEMNEGFARLRAETHEQGARLRVEMHEESAKLRQEIAQSRVEILKWMIVLWVGQLSATIGLLALALRLR